MQVALATLWSCFPVSASGADVLLFSLLHTSSGSCCSPETNHGLLRSSRSPLFFLSLSLSLCFLSPHYLSLLTVFFFLSLSQVLSISLSFSYSLCFPLVTPKQPSLSMGIQEQGRGQDLSEAALPGEKKERERQGDLSLSSTPPQSLSAQLILFCWKRRSLPSPPTLNLYLLYLFNCWCLAVLLRVVSRPCWQPTFSVAYR